MENLKIKIFIISFLTLAIFTTNSLGESIQTADSVFNQAHKLFDNGSYNEAFKLFVKSSQLYEFAGRIHEKINSDIKIAEICYYKDDYNKLEKYFDIISKDIKTINADNEQVYLEFLTLKASYYRYIGDTDKCLPLFQYIENNSGKYKLNNEFKVKLFRQLGHYYFFNIDNKYKSVRMYDSSLYYLRRTDEQPVEEYNTHWTMGQALTRLRKYDEAENHFMECESLFRRFPELFKIEIAYVYGFKIEINSELGNERLIQLFERRLDHTFYKFKDTLTVESERYAFYLNQVKAYINISDFYKQMHKNEVALQYLTKAMAVSNVIPMLDQLVLNKLSFFYLESGDYTKAQKNADGLLRLLLQMNGNVNNDLIETYFLLSEIARVTNNKDKQMEYLEKGLNIKNENTLLKIKCLTNLGILCSEKKKYKQALKLFDTSLTMNAGTIITDKIYINYQNEKVFDKEGVFNTLVEKGYAIFKNNINEKSNEIKLHHFDEAISMICMGISLQKRYAMSISSEYLNDSLNYKKRQSIKYLVEVLIEGYNLTGDSKYLDNALEYIEMNKASVLRQKLHENEAKILCNIPDYLKEQEIIVNTAISSLNMALKGEIGKRGIDYEMLQILSDSLQTLKKKRTALIKYLEGSYPDYFRLKYSNTSISINEIKREINNEQAIIEYFLYDDFLFAILITDECVQYFRSEIDKSFYNKIMNFRNIIETEAMNAVDFNSLKKFAGSGRELYRILLTPFAEFITNKSLIIIPDGIIALIPFDVLVSDKTDTAEYTYYSELPYLIKTNTISYAFSATVLFTNRSKTNQFNNIIAFAPVNYPDRSLKKNLKDITGTELEIREISKIFPTKLYIKNRASESNFKGICDKSSIFHLAMHTIIDEQNSMYSKMIFHPEHGNRKEDGSLFAYEIYDLTFNSPLVVLSSCESGVGELKQGEGYKSMAWGFKYAGIPSVIMTLWSVTDKTSAELMKGFYKHLKEGLTKDKALQKAKLEYIAHCDPLKSNPYYWASFNLLGDTSALEVKHSLNYKYLAFFFTFLITYIIYQNGFKKYK